MRRWLSIAAFGVILLAVPVWAQRHGGSGGGGSHFSSGSSGHSFSGSSFSASHGGDYGGSVTHSAGVGVQGFRSSYATPNYRRRTVSKWVYYYPYGNYYRYGAYPYYGWYSGWPGYQTDDQNQTADVYADPSNPGPYRDESGLQSDVQALSGKIDRLQADVEARNRPKPEQEPATALVFRDQHVEEVHNYAIAGGMLWVLNEEAAKKIPLAQLDLDATVKMNDDRGVDFQVPGPTLQLMIVR
jgi:hypothetical protein